MERLQVIDGGAEDVAGVMREMGVAARRAQRAVSAAAAETIDRALVDAADAVRRAAPAILAANARDLAEARDLTAASRDRLTLDPDRIRAVARSLEEIAELPSPVGRVLARFDRPNGLVIERVSTPLGVIGVVYESRPNVTADAGALCLKSGNAAVLRGGSESFHSTRALHACLVEGLAAAGLPPAAISLVPTRHRDAVGEMLRGLGGNLDVLVPRGGKALVARVQAEARVPVFAHLEGLVHLYVDAAADPDMAEEILLNSKLRRTGVCGAAETLLVHESHGATLLPRLVKALLDRGCAVRGDAATLAADPRVTPAEEADWRTEYLDSTISARVVPDLRAAVDHIETYGSHHTDGIVTRDLAAAATFMDTVDSAIVVHNASTQFADGGEFGFGGEIGIATGRMHARGPVGLEQLCSFKYRVRGEGQTRP